jgi:hypothetical protein
MARPFTNILVYYLQEHLYISAILHIVKFGKRALPDIEKDTNQRNLKIFMCTDQNPYFNQSPVLVMWRLLEAHCVSEPC